MTNFFDKFNNVAAYDALFDETRSKKFTAAFGVQQNEKICIAAGASSFVLYVTSDYVDAQRVLRNLNSLKGGFAYLPYKEDVLLYKQSASGDNTAKGNFALDATLRGELCGLVVCVESLTQPLPPIELFKNSPTAEEGQNLAPTKLAAMLVRCGYKRVSAITASGEFTLRGDIAEIFAPQGRFRLDFWGDEIESIRVVGDDGKSGEKVKSVHFAPLVGTATATAEVIAKVAEYASKQKLPSDSRARLDQIIDKLQVAASNGAVDNTWLAPFLQRSSLCDFLPPETLVLWDEPKLVADRIRFLYSEHDARLANLFEAGEVLPVHSEALLDRTKIIDSYSQFAQISLQTLPYGGTFFTPRAICKFNSTPAPSYTQLGEQFVADVKNWQRSGYEVALLAGEGSDLQATARQLADVGCYFSVAERLEPGSAEGLLLPVSLERGYVSHTNKLVVLGTRDVGRNVASVVGKSKKQVFLSVEKGDYVVHDVHGIGLCEGVQKIDNGYGAKDYVVVLYKKGDRLYVPVENSNLLSRYSGGEKPTLSRIGGEDFAKVKSKVKEGIKEMSLNLLQLYAEREKARGFSYKVDDYLAEEFAAAFPHRETPDQLKCIEEINADLSSERIMDRLLVGDVGYGKTEVAMRAVFNVVANGKQAAVMVPTTILAEQHYKTFSERMQPFDVKVACVNRFRSAKEQKKTLEDLKNGKIDVVVGTHRLLSRDVSIPNLGILVLDEEQRFGVEHKEFIKSLKSNVDVLTLSATPIPRTLHMALSGIRDISTLTTPPGERQPVATFVVEASDALIRDVITRELGRGGQVFLLYNRVENIEFFAEHVRDLVPEAKIAVAHGQMQESVLEDAVYAFQQGNSNVLICTTIIENGIDIPNANTLIVYDADNLGLSQLYQLRGRVGRSDRLAYAYFTYREGKVLTEVAFKRLSSITEYSELGSGFKIAMKDLEIRGAGNVLGREQHGHMMKVGYEMYARLLRETVAELKGKPVEKKRVSQIEVDADAFAPEDYIEDGGERMDLYRELADAETLQKIDELQEKIVQAYGALPRQAVNLFETCRLKVMSTAAGVKQITMKNASATLEFFSREDMMRKEVFDAVAELAGKVTFAKEGYAVLFRSTEYMQRARLTASVKDFLTRCVNRQ